MEDTTDAGLANLLRALEISARANGIVLKGPQVFHTSVVDAGGDPVQSVELHVKMFYTNVLKGAFAVLSIAAVATLMIYGYS